MTSAAWIRVSISDCADSTTSSGGVENFMRMGGMGGTGPEGWTARSFVAALMRWIRGLKGSSMAMYSMRFLYKLVL
ncbi:hypothetical protein IMZ48_33045 [Candidatus Bathyarchaeota archaeon]|nr:hypothetical protein [Candidatus Bathyarchaeota archaeon]